MERFIRLLQTTPKVGENEPDETKNRLTAPQSGLSGTAAICRKHWI